MAKVTSLHTTIQALIGKDGYTFGKPWYAKETSGAIVPIILTRASEKRGYLLIEEVKDKVHFSDSGGISHVTISTHGVSQPIFIRSGMILKGVGTQSRAVELSKIIVPEEGDNSSVDVRCVHASHPIKPGAEFNLFESTPVQIHGKLMHHNQARVWESVHRFAMNLDGDTPSNHSPSSHQFGMSGMGSIASDDLVGRMSSNEYVNTMNKYIREIPSFENQVGIIVIDSEGVVGIALYDHPESWKVSSENVIKKYGEAFTTPAKGKSQTQIDDEQVEKAISKFLELLLNASSLNDAKDGVRYVGGAGVKGEYTVLKSKVIHIIALRQGADDIEKEDRRPRRVVMSWDVDEEPIRPHPIR